MSDGNETIVEIGKQTTKAVGANREALTEELERIRRVEDLSESAKARYSDEATPKAGARHAEHYALPSPREVEDEITEQRSIVSAHVQSGMS